MKCPKCGSVDYIKKGKTGSKKQRYKCKSCNHRFTFKTALHQKAKILLFDIETAPMEVYVWQLKNNNYINISQIIHDWFIICWRAKWLMGDEVFGACQTPQEARNRDDKRVTKELWKMIDEADILIAHNLKNFDLKKANSKFLLHGLNPPSPFQTIDTLLCARQQFKMSSNKLDYLCQILGIGAKLDTGFDLWKGCLRGDKKDLDMMYKYCGQDTTILEDLYLRLRPWIKSHPNMALYCEIKENRCGNCGSDNLSHTSKPYYTPVGEFEVYRCNECGAMVRSRMSRKRDKELLRTLAR